MNWKDNMVLVGGELEADVRKAVELAGDWIASRQPATPGAEGSPLPRFTGVRSLIPLEGDAAAEELLRHVADAFPKLPRTHRDLAIRAALMIAASPTEFENSFRTDRKRSVAIRNGSRLQ